MVFDKPNLVIFDLDGTLYDYEANHKRGTQALEKFLSDELGIDGSVVKAEMSTARINVKDRLGQVASSQSRLLYIREFLLKNRIASDLSFSLRGEKIYWDAYLEKAALFPYVKEFIERLKSRGSFLVLITDLNTEIQLRKIMWFGLENAFDLIITSEEAGGDKITGKPETLLTGLDQPIPEIIWSIGDQNHDHLLKPYSTFFLKTTEQEKFVSSDKIIYFSNYSDLIQLLQEN